MLRQDVAHLTCLALAKGMSELFAKNVFNRPSLKHSVGSSDTCYSRNGFRWDEQDEQCAVPGQGRLRQVLHRTKKIDLYFRGVNGPPLQTIIVIMKASYTALLPDTMLAEEIHEDSCGKAKTMRPHNERGNCLSKLLCSLAPRKPTAKRY